MPDRNHNPYGCNKVSRRMLLSDMGMGMTGLVLGSMLHRDGVARAAAPADHWSPPDGTPHFAPRAKSVIWFFFIGGMSHLESFDHKPALNKYAGKPIKQTPHAGVLDDPRVREVTERHGMLVTRPLGDGAGG